MINLLKKNNPNTKNKMNWLKKINPKISRKIKKEENLKWFNSKINEILSKTRYFSRSPDSNKKKIDRIISLNKANKIIEILNSKIFIFTILNGLSFLSLLLILYLGEYIFIKGKASFILLLVINELPKFFSNKFSFSSKSKGL